MTKNFFKIEIDGLQFKSAYLVYVVKVTSKNHGQFFYIGQTGDRHFLTARPAFRRLAGHLSDQGNSTENQIYRAIAVQVLKLDHAKEKRPFDKETKEAMTNFLTDCKIEMFVHPLADFSQNSNLDAHKSNREFAEQVENELINHFVGLIGKEKVLNKKLPSNKGNYISEITSEIINHINSN